jgi:hypothetical protein
MEPVLRGPTTTRTPQPRPHRLDLVQQARPPLTPTVLHARPTTREAPNVISQRTAGPHRGPIPAKGHRQHRTPAGGQRPAQQLPSTSLPGRPTTPVLSRTGGLAACRTASPLANEAGGRRERASPSGSACDHRRHAGASGQHRSLSVCSPQLTARIPPGAAGPEAPATVPLVPVAHCGRDDQVIGSLPVRANWRSSWATPTRSLSVAPSTPSPRATSTPSGSR